MQRLEQTLSLDNLRSVHPTVGINLDHVLFEKMGEISKVHGPTIAPDFRGMSVQRIDIKDPCPGGGLPPTWTYLLTPIASKATELLNET